MTTQVRQGASLPRNQRELLWEDTKMKKLFAVLLAIAMLASFAACSASKPASDVSADSATPTIDKIKEAGKLVVLTNATFPPFEYIGDDGEVVGVDADIAKLIADKIGVALEIVDMDFDLLVEALVGGKGDMIAAGMTATDEKKLSIDFSDTYIKMGLQVIVPVGSDIKSFDDLAGKKIAVQLGTTGDAYATENVEGAEVLPFKGMVEAGQAVVSGNADAAIIDVLPAEYIVKQNADKIELLGLISEEDIALGVAKGQEDFLALINEVLKENMENGTIDQQFDLHMASFDADAY